MSDHRDATDEEAERAAAHVFKKHGVALQRLARIECAERLEYISRTFGKQGARTRTLLQAAAYLRGCTCVPAAPALPPDEMPVTITLERANQSAHAIRQWLDYGQQSFDAHHHVGDKSHAGYFSDGGWACEELKRLLVALTTAALPPVETDVLRCLDCGLPYRDFPMDTTLPDDQWLALNDGDPGKVLCAGCIAKRGAARLPNVIALRAHFECALVEADTMPTIEVGDVLFLHEFGHLYGNHTEVTSKEIADWFNRPENIVVAIYRDPLWRRPAPTGGQ